jgi:hypothetical protein
MSENGRNVQHEILLQDYEQTNQNFRMLVDIRFKLLAFIPLLAGGALTIVSQTSVTAELALVTGALGLFATVGIVVYELRNTEFHDAAVHRAKWLERKLLMPLATKGRAGGGLFMERPRRTQRLFRAVEIWHDRGLSIVYGAAVGAWFYILTNSALAIAGRKSLAVSLAVAVTTAALFMGEFIRIAGPKNLEPAEDEQGRAPMQTHVRAQEPGQEGVEGRAQERPAPTPEPPWPSGRLIRAYLLMLPPAVAVLPLLLAGYDVLPIHQSRAGFLPAYAAAACFLTFGLLFHYRDVLPGGRAWRWLGLLLPPVLLFASVMFLYGYHRSLPAAPTDDANAPWLNGFYLSAFVAAELAVSVMAVNEYRRWRETRR